MVPAADLLSLPALRSATSQRTGCCERRAYTRIVHKSKGRSAFLRRRPRLCFIGSADGSDLHQREGVADIGDDHRACRQSADTQMGEKQEGKPKRDA